MQKQEPLLDVSNLRTWLGSRKAPIRAVDGVSFSVAHRTTVALVGESGCGKSVTALSLTGLIPRPPVCEMSGTIRFDGRTVSGLDARGLASIRGRHIAYVFQEPGSALNPVFRVGAQIEESVRLSGRDVGSVREEVVRLMQLVGLPDPERRRLSYPHELSGGMQQRVMIAMALASEPRLLVADEPTTALDVTIQAQIMELLRMLQDQLGMSMLLITHNLGLVADTAHRVYVMYAGQIVESGPTESVLAHPLHPYTRGLMDAVPRLDTIGRMLGIPGQLPRADERPTGCLFAPRCPRADDRCRERLPDLESRGDDRAVRCIHPLE
ncbi:MAG: hypothetical protein A2498_04330 [Lentisphaerae bacterium RIFOXYC12_FULL_60_16]|nr:MAG: hypothetical protein A2498_04330 [Lentisphaerae bacterium RIFOXYC12_FULL_60_16]